MKRILGSAIISLMVMPVLAADHKSSSVPDVDKAKQIVEDGSLVGYFDFNAFPGITQAIKTYDALKKMYESGAVLDLADFPEGKVTVDWGIYKGNWSGEGPFFYKTPIQLVFGRTNMVSKDSKVITLPTLNAAYNTYKDRYNKKNALVITGKMLGNLENSKFENNKSKNEYHNLSFRKAGGRIIGCVYAIPEPGWDAIDIYFVLK
ncbi:MAG: hypothetical protein WCS77_08220 [Elusimicrobiaceae bacterium]|jgi:hypothetical protein